MSKSKSAPPKQEDVDQMFGLINTKQTNFDLAAYVSQFFAFEGFDPAAFISRLLTINSNKQELFEDMIACCTWIAMRGTNISNKNLLRTNETGRSLMNALISKYKIEPRLGKQRNEITMGRIAAVFAPQMVQILTMGVGRVVGNRPENLPAALCFPSAPAVIPQASVFDPLFNAWVEWSISFTAVIQPTNRQAGAPNYAGNFREQSEKFGKIARTSSLLSDKQRLALLIDCGIITTNKEGTTAFVDANPRRTIGYGEQRTTLDRIALLAGGVPVPTDILPNITSEIVAKAAVEPIGITTVTLSGSTLPATATYEAKSGGGTIGEGSGDKNKED